MRSLIDSCIEVYPYLGYNLVHGVLDPVGSAWVGHWVPAKQHPRPCRSRLSVNERQPCPGKSHSLVHVFSRMLVCSASWQSIGRVVAPPPQKMTRSSSGHKPLHFYISAVCRDA